jgi:predicted nucleic acid-binding protein
MAGVTLDAGALIALEKADRKMLVLLERARQVGARVTLPAPVLAQVLRRPERQVRVVRLARQGTTDVVSLDRSDAVSIGRLLASVGASDVVDAHVVVCARRANQPVVTSDSEDLRRLDPGLLLLAI